MSEREREGVLEVVEVVVLAIVAIATAWSSYQSTQWGGRQSMLYGTASTLRFEAEAASTRGGQELVADSAMFTAWLQAHEAGDRALEARLEERFSSDYHDAFEAWLATDPFDDPAAPPGPGFMPGFTNPRLTEAATLNDRASASFAEGTAARDTANRYARATVLLATVLFLIAIAQRFQVRGVRLATVGLALIVMVATLANVATLAKA